MWQSKTVTYIRLTREDGEIWLRTDLITHVQTFVGGKSPYKTAVVLENRDVVYCDETAEEVVKRVTGEE